MCNTAGCCAHYGNVPTMTAVNAEVAKLIDAYGQVPVDEVIQCWFDSSPSHKHY
jgi:hypothetical protein